MATQNNVGLGMPQLVVWGVAAVLALMLLSGSVFVVRQTEQVMIVQLGQIVRQLDKPGLYFKLPFVQNLIYFDKRVLSADSPPEEVTTQDRQQIIVDSFTRWQIVDVGRFYRSVRNIPTALQRLDNVVNSNIRVQVAQVKLVDLVNAQRDDVMRKILQESQEEAKEFGIRVVDVRFNQVELPVANRDAVFGRMRADRQKEASERRAEGDEAAAKIRAEAEKNRTILLAEAQKESQTKRGEGDAQAFRISGQAFSRDPGFYELTRSLQAYEGVFQPNNTMLLIDPNSGFMKQFNQ